MRVLMKRTIEEPGTRYAKGSYWNVSAEQGESWCNPAQDGGAIAEHQPGPTLDVTEVEDSTSTSITFASDATIALEIDGKRQQTPVTSPLSVPRTHVDVVYTFVVEKNDARGEKSITVRALEPAKPSASKAATRKKGSE